MHIKKPICPAPYEIYGIFSQLALLYSPLGARNQIQRTNSTTGKLPAPLTSPACSPPATTPWCSSLTKQVHVALYYQVDGIVPLFHYSTRLCVPENEPNGQILQQKNNKNPSIFPACSPPSNRYLCSNPIKQVHMALSCLVNGISHFGTTSLGSGCQKNTVTDKFHHKGKGPAPPLFRHLLHCSHPPWYSSLTKQVRMALYYQEDEIVPPFSLLHSPLCARKRTQRTNSSTEK
jgi:hypothetical protein